MKGIDFSKLSLKDALDLAILIEEEARERYEEFVHQMEVHHTPEAAQFFRVMAENETKHGDELSKHRARLFGNAPVQVRREMLWDVEAPEYDKASIFMSARQAMNVALECETKAHLFFVRALEDVGDPAVRKLFEELRDEEIHHQELVLRQISRLPDTPDADPEDYADGPVAQ